MSLTKATLVLVVLASAAALPVKPRHGAPAVTGGTCGADHQTEGGCMADPCCNWCNHAEAPFAEFCTDSNPWIPTRLTCKRDPAEAEASQAKCHLEKKAAKPALNASAVDAKHFATMCQQSDQAACDEMPCCQWCSVESFPAAAFCVPQIEKQGDNLQCSKTVATCSDIKGQDECSANEACAWQPFFEGGGQCYYDWSRCNAPTPEPTAA